MTTTRWPAFLAAFPLFCLMILPIVALVLSSTPSELTAATSHPSFAPALWLSARTTAFSLVAVIVTGTPLAWWLATAETGWTRLVQTVVDIPIVLPPAVVGIALLQTFGRSGLLGEPLTTMGLQIPFTTTAVVLAQVTISAPFYVQASAAAFRRVDPDLLLVARTLGQTPLGAFFRVTVPLALPGMLGGAAMAWARALGEFGATLLFAGNQPGVSQTMPLAIFMTLETDVRVALALALVLGGLSVLVLLALRMGPSFWSQGSPAARQSATS